MAAVSFVVAESTVDPGHSYAWGPNVGWIQARGDDAHGAVIGASYCTGYLWSANCGWVGLGNGPTNGWRYSNSSVMDWGVNHDGEGRLSGFAYGANLGWLAFDQTNGQPRIDLRTGAMSGFIWGANIGWIGLSNSHAHVRSNLDPGPDADGDGIPDPWEYARADGLGTLSNALHDADGDTVPDADEYAADTDPGDAGDALRLVGFTTAASTQSVAWTCRPTRLYALEAAPSPAVPDDGWSNVMGGLVGPPADSPMTQHMAAASATTGFYRVRSLVPLSPP